MVNAPVSSLELTTAKFSPLLLSRVVIDSLRYFFRNMNKPEFRYSDDPKESALVIDTMNNFLQRADEVQKKPRILFQRGTYSIQKTSMTGDLVTAKSMEETKGSRSSSHMNITNGNYSIIIEAFSEGVCELLADMVATFLTWSSDHIANMFRFKQFGYPMVVQECSLDQEDREKFKIVIGSSYTTETAWTLNEDAIKLRGLFLDLQQI